MSAIKTFKCENYKKKPFGKRILSEIIRDHYSFTPSHTIITKCLLEGHFSDFDDDVFEHLSKLGRVLRARGRCFRATAWRT